MARKSSGKRPRKKRAKKPAKTADLPVTLPPFGRDTTPPSGWNVQDESANQVARQIAERQRQNVAATFGGQGGAILDPHIRRGPQTIYAEILRHIDAIEEIIPQLPGIGHNKPPEPIEQPPLTGNEIAEINVHITIVKSLPAAPAELPTAVGRAAERLKALGDKLVKCAAVVGGISTLWEKLGDHLIAAGNLVTEWIKVLMNLF